MKEYINIILVLICFYFYYSFFHLIKQIYFNENIVYYNSEEIILNDKDIINIYFYSYLYLPINNETKRCNFINIHQFINYFFPNKLKFRIVNNIDRADIVINDIYNYSYNNNKINMLICVENLEYWKLKFKSDYKHFTKYGHYGNNNMNLYLYNDIYNIYKTDDILAIPMRYIYINYLIKNYNNVKPNINTQFKDKKFCLMINKSKLNSEIDNISKLLSSIGTVDNISLYNDYINNTSCYHSVELLNVFNKYKFIICFENSYSDGYITEKIFNCLFAKTIPLYKGSKKIGDNINKNCFIDINDFSNDELLNKIKIINNDENIYNSYINNNKISDLYNDENYENEMIEFIKMKKNNI